MNFSSNQQESITYVPTSSLTGRGKGAVKWRTSTPCPKQASHSEPVSSIRLFGRRSQSRRADCLHHPALPLCLPAALSVNRSPWFKTRFAARHRFRHRMARMGWAGRCVNGRSARFHSGSDSVVRAQATQRTFREKCTRSGREGSFRPNGWPMEFWWMAASADCRGHGEWWI